MHRRHCTCSPLPAVLRNFKLHMLNFYGISSNERRIESKHIEGANHKPTALLIVREGRRRILNPNDILALLSSMGYDARTTGPFVSMTLQEQLETISNSSLIVYLHGAEIGPVWLGMSEGACASLIFPFRFEDTLAWWAGEPLGLRIAPFFEAPVNEFDERLRLPQVTADDFIANYNRDVWVDTKRLRNTLWCADKRLQW